MIHETSIIDPGVKIGKGTKIWHWCHVMSDIGEHCMLGQNVFIGKNVKIGNGVRIQNGVSVFEGVEIEDYVFLGPSCVFTNDLRPRVAFKKALAVRTILRKRCSIGANATIVCGIEIGECALIGAGAVVTKSIPPYYAAWGNPARIRHQINSRGEKERAGIRWLRPR